MMKNSEKGFAYEISRFRYRLCVILRNRPLR